MLRKVEIGIVKKQGIFVNQVKYSYLSLGSNLGNREQNLNKAKYLLNIFDIKIIKCSNLYETESWPNKKYPKYLNIVIKIRTFNTLIELFRKIKLIEKILGRKKTIKNSPRTCDIDILDFDQKMFDKTVDNSQLIVPHPRLHNRNFVLIPLFDIDKNWKHPKLKLNITKLLSKMGSNNLRSIKLI